jgi:hypothetical protein
VEEERSGLGGAMETAGSEKQEQGKRGLSNVVQIDEKQTQIHLDELVRTKIEETLNALLEAEADRLCRAKKCEHSQVDLYLANCDTGGDSTVNRAVNVRCVSLR